MKKLKWVFLAVIVAIIFNIGRSFYIVSKVESLISKHSDAVSCRGVSWEWSGARVDELKINTSAGLATMDFVHISHNVTNPFALRILGGQLTYPSATVGLVQGTFKFGDNQVKSENVIFSQVEVDLEKTKLVFPTVSAKFTYIFELHDLDFDVYAPALSNKEFEKVALVAEGKIVTKPQLDGRLNLRVRGIDNFINGLSDLGIMKPTQAGLLAFGSGFFKNKKGEVKLPLTFEKGHIYLGPVKLK